MALTAYLSLKGSKQGAIKGDVIQKGRENQIAVYAANHQINTPFDAVTGLRTGKQVHKPLMITKEIDRSTPQLFQALITNEAISEFILRFWSPRKSGPAAASGVEVQIYTITLTNASIVSIETNMDNNKIDSNLKLPVFEMVAFAYDSIEWKWMDPVITATGAWKNVV